MAVSAETESSMASSSERGLSVCVYLCLHVGVSVSVSSCEFLGTTAELSCHVQQCPWMWLVSMRYGL